MQLGKALIGAIIGAALGVGLLAAVYLVFKIDHVALAIAVALLTGLGVRALVSTSGHASYARGALTGVLALAAYVAGWMLVAELAKARAAAAPKPAPVVARAEQPASDEPEATRPAGDAAVMPDARQVDRSTAASNMPKAGAPGQNPLDYLWLAIAGLVAYELGRGTGVAPASTTPADDTLPADGTMTGDPALSRGPETTPPPPQVVRSPD
jgi:hypothetical protein